MRGFQSIHTFFPHMISLCAVLFAATVATAALVPGQSCVHAVGWLRQPRGIHLRVRTLRADARADALDAIVRQELAELAVSTPEEQEERLPTLLARVEERVTAENEGYQFGDITKSVVESMRSEVQRQMSADWTMADISLLLKVGVFLGAGAAAPVAGLAAMPAAVLLATYGTVLKAELGVRAVKEVGVRLTERASQGIADSVKDYTGKDEYKFGDLTEATVRKVTGSDEYKFGDLTKGAVKRVTGKDEYRFGDISKSIFKRLKGSTESG